MTRTSDLMIGLVRAEDARCQELTNLTPKELEILGMKNVWYVQIAKCEVEQVGQETVTHSVPSAP